MCNRLSQMNPNFEILARHPSKGFLGNPRNLFEWRPTKFSNFGLIWDTLMCNHVLIY